MATSSRPRHARPGQHAHLGWALVLISVAQLMVVLDATIANIALPYIGQDLDISQANLSWVVTGYALAFGGLLLLGGRLGDLYGRRRIFMIGLTVFAIASLLGGLAQNEGLLLGARGLQGFGAALASPTALALITTTFPAGPQRNRAFAVYAAMSGAGAAVGLILGGWLTGLDGVVGLDFNGWRLTFLINVPIGLAAAFIAPRCWPSPSRTTASSTSPAPSPAPSAWSASSTASPGQGRPTTAGATRRPSCPWPSASCCSAIFALIEPRVEHPLLPFRILRNRTRAASFVAMMLAPGRDVRDVLLPQPVRPADRGLQPAAHRLRVPAVLVRHRHRRPASRPSW